MTHLRRMRGYLNYIGHGVLPPACPSASELLKSSSTLTVSVLNLYDSSLGNTVYNQTVYISRIQVSDYNEFYPLD